MPDSRRVEVPLRRLQPWLRGFQERHGQWTSERCADPPGWRVTAVDATRALIADPQWLAHVGSVQELATLASSAPSYGVILIRRAGYAVGAFEGAELVDRKVGSRHIHGRTSAGGWSQQRYARRRANQAGEIVGAVADHAERILASRRPAFLVTGGDRPLVKDLKVLLRPPLADVPIAMHLGVGAPDASVLAGCADRVLAVQILVDA